MNTSHLMSAASLALGLAFAAPARAAEALPSDTVPAGTHARLMAQLRDFQNRQHPGPALQPWTPGLMVTGYDRATLDRGGWSNPFVAGDHYAAGQPLQAAKVGGGVTSGGADPVVPTPRLAAR